jgi:hypothetical protein
MLTGYILAPLSVVVSVLLLIGILKEVPSLMIPAMVILVCRYIESGERVNHFAVTGH